MAAGYSGTPLLKKLGVKDGQSALLIAVPEDITALSEFKHWRRVKAAKTPRGIAGGPYDYAHLFTSSDAVLNAALPAIRKTLADDGMIWVSWPKKASGVPSTVTEDTIRNLALTIGLVDIKVCAVNEIWSGLKLVVPIKSRKKK